MNEATHTPPPPPSTLPAAPEPPVQPPAGEWTLAQPFLGRVFRCVCERPVFFRNSQCLHCGHALGYVPDVGELVPLEPQQAQPLQDGSLPLQAWLIAGERADGVAWQRCSNLDSPARCNWLLRADEAAQHNGLCRCCRLNRMVPDISVPAYANLWHRVELGKRRMVSSLIALGLPVASRLSEDTARGLAFDLLVNAIAPMPVMTGHRNGVITLNVAEADDDERTRRRMALYEPYRTLLGHLRHESGHYYWDGLIAAQPERHAAFREVFGDDSLDYGMALSQHYANGPSATQWQSDYVSAYATAHPWEDWAETWAHYLHMVDALDTALSAGVDFKRVEQHLEDPFDVPALCQVALPVPQDAMQDNHFLAFVNAWVALTAMMNELSRSMGQHDFYPFVMSVPAVAKLHFVHRFVTHIRESVQGRSAPLFVATQDDATSAQPVADAVAA
jgi:hypothetical protein